MQIAAQDDFFVHQMDVKTAYLHAAIEEDIYLEQPEGFEETSDIGDKLVYKLKKISVWSKTVWKELVQTFK